MRTLDPVTDPHYNLRQCAKDMMLCEEHLSVANKRCYECIQKHFMRIEALLEEALTLDKGGELPASVSDMVRVVTSLHDAAMGGADPERLAQDLRKLRKAITKYLRDRAASDGTYHRAAQVYSQHSTAPPPQPSSQPAAAPQDAGVIARLRSRQ